MKTCSKCRMDLSEVWFVKSPRYSDGLYPSCKGCQKEAHMRTLEIHQLCSRCGQLPHEKGQPYCYTCGRIVKGRSPAPKFRRDPDNQILCSRCKQTTRLNYHRYCQECKNQSTRDWLKKQRPEKPFSEKRRKRSARSYINGLHKRGKVKRQPCKYCGNPSVHFHHLDYKDRTRNVEHVCLMCHVLLEREKRKTLTKQR